VHSAAILVALLAAGRATRFGGGKVDALCAGRPLAIWAIEAVERAGLAPGVCVTGPQEPHFLSRAAGWERVVNPQPQDGLAGSLAVAAKVAEQRRSAALLVVLADMPLVTPALLVQLAAQDGAAATDHGDGRRGVPALLPRALFPALAEVSGDRGASALLATLPRLVLLEPEPGSLLDVDTPADLARAEAMLRGRDPG
jgi:CTP:molybdopterin cytidylyltransferase MocA